VPARVLDPGDEYVLNHCTKQINRSGFDENSSATISEAWRFPIVVRYPVGITANTTIRPIFFICCAGMRLRPPSPIRNMRGM
jgi:hypothetical protein